MVVMKVETDIITSITAGQIGQAVIPVIMFADNFKTDIIMFISNCIICL